MTQEEMLLLVPEKLKEIERLYHISVLFAVESGSRAWGVASPDSDFDVRFLYKRAPRDYLRLDPMRDVIEIPIDSTWGVAGWDLMKALKLLHQSNPGLYDWFGSPVVYWDDGFKERFSPLMQLCFSRSRMLHNHHGIAARHYGDVLKDVTVSPKKYFYALRSVLACRWIDRFDSAPPVLFSELTAAVLPAEQKETVDYILEQKSGNPEKSRIDRLPDMDRFLQEQLLLFEEKLRTLPREEPFGWDELNAFFLSELGLSN